MASTIAVLTTAGARAFTVIPTCMCDTAEYKIRNGQYMDKWILQQVFGHLQKYMTILYNFVHLV